MKYCIVVLAALLCLGAPLPSHAELTKTEVEKMPPSTAEFIPTAQEKKIIQQAEKFLNGIHTMQAKFQQVMPMNGSMPGGSISEGTVYLKRPGLMKWVYETPSQVEIFLEKERVIYYDKELDQVSYAPLEHLLASLIAQDDISLTDGNIKVIGVKQDDTGIRVTLEQRAKPKAPTKPDVKTPEEGASIAEKIPEPKDESEATESPQQITMTFLNPDTDMYLYSMDILDEAGRSTRIEFSDVAYDVPLDDAVFEFKNPRLFNPKKRN